MNNRIDRGILFLAQGLGLGRIPLAPGTWGTLLGLPLTFGLLAAGHAGLYLLGTLAGLVLAVGLCGEAEQLLGRKDPASVVLDEAVALPLAFLGWFFVEARHSGQWPSSALLLEGSGWVVIAAVFVGFRAFDILKPWPIRQLQGLWSGLGVVADDVVAALYVALLSALVISRTGFGLS